jgi:Tfp pilus assembly protein PilO
MKNKSSEKKTGNKIVIASAAIVLIVAMIGVMFIYVPFAEKNKSLRADILRERDKNVLIGKIKAFGKHLKVYDKRIPESGGVSWLLGEVSNLASKEKIEISSIQPGNPEDYTLYAKLFVIVDVSSSFDQLGKFIAMVESSEKILKIESVSMKRMDLDENFNKGSGKFKAFDVRANIVISTVTPKE